MKSNMFWDVLYKIRKNRAWSSQEAADALEISREMYERYENRIEEPNLDTIISIAEVFKVSLDFLISGKQKSYPIEGVRVAAEHSPFGKVLVALREKNGWSQIRVARKLNAQLDVYQSYEEGELQPDYSTVIKIADLYAVTIDTLIRGGGVYNLRRFDIEDVINEDTSNEQLFQAIEEAQNILKTRLPKK